MRTGYIARVTLAGLWFSLCPALAPQAPAQSPAAPFSAASMAEPGCRLSSDGTSKVCGPASLLQNARAINKKDGGGALLLVPGYDDTVIAVRKGEDGVPEVSLIREDNNGNLIYETAEGRKQPQMRAPRTRDYTDMLRRRDDADKMSVTVTITEAPARAVTASRRDDADVNPYLGSSLRPTLKIENDTPAKKNAERQTRAVTVTRNTVSAPQRRPAPKATVTYNNSRNDGAAPVSAGLEYNEEALTLVNAFRQRNGRKPLLLSGRMSQDALSWSKRMAADFDKAVRNRASERAARNKAFRHSDLPYAENIAYNYRDGAERAVQQWIESPGHRKNMLGNHRYMGIAFAQDADGAYYWTQVFK